MNPVDQVFTVDNFRLIIEHAPIGIVIIDKDYKWLLTNKRFSEITGYSREELQDKTFLDITYKEDLANNVNLYQQMISGRFDEYAYEKRYVRKDGRIIWVRLSVAGVRLSGQYSYMIGLVQDIDDNKHNQVDLEFRNKELDTLFYKVSHDLKAPVATLAGLIHLLEQELHPNGSKSFEHLVDTVKKMEAQNAFLIQLARVNEFIFKPSATSFSVLVAAALEGKNISVRIDSADDRLITDPFLLTVVLKNLFDNTLHFCGPESKAGLKLMHIESDYRIIFQDNGPGIPEEFAQRVFDMFFKASEKSKGSGLGLYIVRKAIEKMKGDIRVIYPGDQGTTFEITLPKH